MFQRCVQVRKDFLLLRPPKLTYTRKAKEGSCKTMPLNNEILILHATTVKFPVRMTDLSLYAGMKIII